MEATYPPTQLLTGIVEDKNPLLGVIGVVGAGVILKGPDPRVANRPHRPPVQVSEVDDEVGGYTPHLGINVIGLKNLGSQRPSSMIGQGFQLSDQFIPNPLIMFGRDLTLGFPALNVQKKPAVIPSRTPGQGFAPVHHLIFKTGGLIHPGFEGQIPLPDQPIVKTDPPVHLFSTMIGDHQNHRILVQQG